MERLKRNIYVLAGILAVAGLTVTAFGTRKAVQQDENDLEKMLPVRVLGAEYVPGREDDGQTYKMTDMSYRVLQATFGIVCRVYDINGDSFDTVIVASRAKDSFHDPNICFSAQGWLIEKRTVDYVQTELRGKVPYTRITAYNEQRRSRSMAAFLYKGPEGFVDDTNVLKLQFLREEMMLGDNLDGVFYRFIPEFRGTPTEEEQEEKLERFIGAYLDEAHRTSGGKI